MESTETIYQYLREEFGDTVVFTEAETGQSWITVPATSVKVIAKFLRDNEKLRFNTLMCLSGVHYPKEDQLGVTYHLHSTTLHHTLVVKVIVPVEDPVVQSVESIWKTANWHEREAWDLLGIRFEGHPNHKRILTPDDWEGHPLRKDYQQQEKYNEITTGP